MHFLVIWEVQKIANCMGDRRHKNGEAQPIDFIEWWRPAESNPNIKIYISCDLDTLY